MNSLGINWITDGLIDLEYKKYLLLAYLQTANKNFTEQKIYPFLGDLVSHYRNLINLKEKSKAAENSFPKILSKIDFEHLVLEYENIQYNDKYLNEIFNIVDYAIPKISDHIHIAKEIHDEVEESISINSIGLVPINIDAGYLLFDNANSTSTDVFLYELSIFEDQYEKYRGLKTAFIESYPHSIINYYETIKLDLIKKNKNLPNPAIYVVQSKINYPFYETLFPVAKRSFMRYLGQNQE